MTNLHPTLPFTIHPKEKDMTTLHYPHPRPNPEEKSMINLTESARARDLTEIYFENKLRIETLTEQNKEILESLAILSDGQPAKIGTPEKPLPQLEVDAKVLVWGPDGRKRNRHFSHFDDEGRMFAFSNGQSSFTNECSLENGVTAWDKWEVVE